MPQMSPTTTALLQVLKGVNSGLTYGVKVRFTHSLVISLLFQSGPLLKRLGSIVEMTKEHAGRLAAFVGIYKTCVLLFEALSGGKAAWHTLLAGLIGGLLVFRAKTVITGQIALYMLPRVLTGTSKLAMLHWGAEKRTIAATFPLLSMVCWGLVMWLFELDSRLLQPSLAKTMQKLYRESDSWSHWTEFVPFGATLKSIVA